jgi:multiple sugar transport system ATP-binding protein
MSNVKLEDITKKFSDVLAVDDISLEINDGELLALVGPSGCGKTTTLRTIAGLEYPTEGNVMIENADVTEISPRHRDIAMVFQDLALYPQKTVRENMLFPLEMRDHDIDEADDQVKRLAQILEIDEMLDRQPSALSGGQQQRVALGRALVRDPAVFLMDEPLASLDAKLRSTMRAEILELHQELEVTIVYVTHDQEIAMTLGDRICVMNEGTIQQIDDPNEVYRRPTNIYVAQFIGSPDMNIFKADIEVTDRRVELQMDTFSVELDDDLSTEPWRDLDGRTIEIGLRPQDIYDQAFVPYEYDAGELVSGDVTIVENIGSVTDVHVEVEGTEFIARLEGDTDVAAADSVELVFDSAKFHVFDPDTGERIEEVDAERGVARKMP